MQERAVCLLSVWALGRALRSFPSVYFSVLSVPPW